MYLYSLVASCFLLCLICALALRLFAVLSTVLIYMVALPCRCQLLLPLVVGCRQTPGHCHLARAAKIFSGRRLVCGAIM